MVWNTDMAVIMVFQIEYHFVWVMKYRYKVLNGDFAERIRDLVREYFCATVGQMMEAMIEQYLAHHFELKPNDNGEF